MAHCGRTVRPACLPAHPPAHQPKHIRRGALPPQESLVGVEYQASVPKQLSRGLASTRADACVWSARAASREMGGRDAISLHDYLDRARVLLDADAELVYDEEVALD
eukprot:6185212-Pleurochrysis_carterae.AAC.1